MASKRKMVEAMSFTIDGMKLVLNREGKAHKGDPLVSRGCGVHTPEKFKEKSRQKVKNDIRKGEW